MFFDGTTAQHTSSRVEREVAVERLDLLQPDVVLKVLPNIQRIDQGHKSLAEATMVYSGKLNYQTTGINLTATIKVSSNRKAWISIGYTGDYEIEATACCNEVAKLFKAPSTSQ